MKNDVPSEGGGIEFKEPRLMNPQVKIEILLESLIFSNCLADKRLTLFMKKII